MDEIGLGRRAIGPEDVDANDKGDIQIDTVI
jgi:hypothetical protein